MEHHAPCGGSGYCPQRQYLERKKDSRRTNLLKQYNKWEKRKWEIKELVDMTSKSDKVFDQKGKNKRYAYFTTKLPIYLLVLEKRNIFAHDIK